MQRIGVVNQEDPDSETYTDSEPLQRVEGITDPDTFLSVEIIVVITISIVAAVLIIVGIAYKIFVFTKAEKDDTIVDRRVNLNRLTRLISNDSVTSF